MGNLNLTEAELALVERAACNDQGMGARLSFYASILIPMVLFAAYGFFRKDFIAEFIAFVGIFIFIIWRISQEVDHVHVYQATMRKLVEHERHREGGV